MILCGGTEAAPKEGMTKVHHQAKLLSGEKVLVKAPGVRLVEHLKPVKEEVGLSAEVVGRIGSATAGGGGAFTATAAVRTANHYKYPGAHNTEAKLISLGRKRTYNISTTTTDD